ncbi:MAG TPA: zinc-binding dehydrogenase [Acidimicrobiales bacterium]|jgi:putative PIG3 family NAD(P)H quinone oxidoreductase|nr:zinc-binding dehydrogenase [Acidimicrobiales bacterium]
MKAVTVVDNKIEIREHPDPAPAKGELLVRVRAAGVNNADLMQVQGLYDAPPGSPPDIPGMELAGEVVAMGDAVTGFAEGDRVMAIVGGGAQAELALVHERLAMRVPETVPFPEAGGFPEVFLTAHDALFTQARVTIGDRVLVHGAAGGVGTAGVQLAAAAGARVTASVRNDRLWDEVARLGAAEVVAHDDFADRGPYDVILELVGAVNMAPNLAALNRLGRIVVIGVGAGARVEVDLFAVMAKRAVITGSTLRSRPLEDKALVTQRAEAHAVPLLADGAVRVLIEETYPLKDAAAAYERFAQGGKLGKIVLVTD